MAEPAPSAPFAAVDVIVPAYNEADSIVALIERLRRACPGVAVTVVDNGSTDGTLERLADLDGVAVVRHPRNLGYGTSLRHGIERSTRPLIVMIDADLEYLPEDVPALVRRLGDAAAVYGSRLLSGGGRPPDMGAARIAGNRLVTGLYNRLFGQHLTDLYTGIRGVRREALPAPLPASPGFEFVLDLAARLAAAGVAIAEVPVGYRPRSSGRSKMRHVREFLKFAVCLVRFRRRR